MVGLLGSEPMGELSMLNLANNSLGDDGASAVAVRLHALPNIRTVILESNDISNAGACALADSLPSVRPCQLSCTVGALCVNMIGPKGIGHRVCVLNCQDQ